MLTSMAGDSGKPKPGWRQENWPVRRGAKTRRAGECAQCRFVAQGKENDPCTNPEVLPTGEIFMPCLDDLIRDTSAWSLAGEETWSQKREKTCTQPA